jgi:hypothetical protein
VLSFLNSLFTSTRQSPDGPDRALVEAAIERVVDATDPRLRAFPNYGKRLYAGVESSLVHIQSLIDGLPEPVEISNRTFGSDARLRTFFSSPARMREAIGSAPSVVDFMANRKGLLPDHIFGLLAPRMTERQALGMELRGETVRRDVLQQIVDFSDYRFFGAAGSESEARDGMKERAFDYLAELALQRMTDLKEKRSELERQRRLLQRKLEAMRAGNWGLEGILAQQEIGHPDFHALGKKIEEVEAELMQLPCSQAGLEQRFDCINATLKRPEDGLAMRQLKLHVDAMLVKVKDPDTASSEPMELTELYSSSGRRRIVVFGYFPRAELPPKKDFFEEAGRYLG